MPNYDDTNSQAGIPQLALERIALGEASDEERRRIAAALAERGETLEERLAALRASNEEIHERYPADMMAARIEARLDERRKSREHEASRPRRGGWFAGLGVLATAAVAAFLFLDLPGTPTGGPPAEPDGFQETVRLKGAEPKLVIWRKSGDEPERLTEGATAHAGDVLQVEYNAADAKYGVIASIDGRGVVTLHFPKHSDGSTALERGVVALDHSYELDDAPDFERFFFISSDTSLDAAVVVDALEALAADGAAKTGVPDLSDKLLSDELNQTDFTVEKK